MKKLLILGLVCLLFLPVMAMADQILADSRAGVVYTCGVDPNAGPGPASCTSGFTVPVTPNPAWFGPIGSSVWVSYNSGTGAGPTTSTNNGTFMTVMDSFIVPNGYNQVTLRVLADDTTGVMVVPVGTLINPDNHLTTPFNTYATCSDVVVGCRQDTEGVFTFAVVAGGAYQVYFQTEQINGSSFGLDYEIAATPEPASLALIGGGLIGIAGVIRRRFAK